MPLRICAVVLLLVAQASTLCDAMGLSLVQVRAQLNDAPTGGEPPYESSSETVIAVGDLDYVNWTLCGLEFHSNLGGLGPDSGEEALRFFDVTQRDGVSVDLVITNTSEYATYNINANGLVKDECFGKINLLAGYDDMHCVNFNFELKESGTNTPVAFEHHYFTVFDLDGGDVSRESVTFYDTNDVYLEDGHVLEESGGLNLLEESGRRAGPGLTFTSTTFGTGADNPSNPMQMDLAQRQRSVTVDYLNKDTWQLTLCVEGGTGGRNFLFSGASNLIPTPSPTPSPTPAPTACQEGEGTCIVFEDPHVVVFDGQQVSLLGGGQAESAASAAGDMWLVKSSRVSIQARYVQRDGGVFMGALAIGGAFLQGHRLIIGGLEGSVTWDGEDILGEQSSEFSVEGLLSARRSLESCHVEAPERVGAGIDLALPEGVFLVVNRQGSYINARIRMLEAAGHQDGLCGNNNGDPADDSFDAIMLERSPVVLDGESLFDE